MIEYENLSHMRKLLKEKIRQAPSYYILHHIISRFSSTTTKYRVIFNASSVDLSGMSLNDCSYLGPTIEAELFDHVIRYRSYAIVFVADVEKMYRMVLIDPNQRKFQHNGGLIHRLKWSITN